jgi:ABC-2 type transport system ATP-binding protein
MATPLLLATDIVKRYRNRTVLDGVTFSLNPSEVVAVVGENGCGKSTFLKICSGVLRPDEGSVVRNGRVGYCPQDPGLLPHLTIDEHLVCFGAGLGLSPAKAIKRGRKHLQALGTKDHEGVSSHLSGGTRQKLNLTLALLGNPDVLLLDEPYQGFDQGTYVNFWELVEGWKQKGKAVMVITHLLSELNRADRVIDLTRGRIERATDVEPDVAGDRRKGEKPRRRTLLSTSAIADSPVHIAARTAQPEQAQSQPKSQRHRGAARPREVSPTTRSEWFDLGSRPDRELRIPRPKPGQPPVVRPRIRTESVRIIARDVPPTDTADDFGAKP